MKKVLSALLAVVMALGLLAAASVTAHAAEVTEGDFTFYVDAPYATLTGYSGPGGNVAVPAYAGGCLVREITEAAFSGCATLTEIFIPGGVAVLGGGLFRDCTSLTKVSIGAGPLTTGIRMRGTAFIGCTAMAEVVVSPDNENYASQDGILFNKEKSGMAYYPANKPGSAYTIPAGVQNIEDYAFADNQNLTDLYIGEQLSTISPTALEGAGLTVHVYWYSSAREKCQNWSFPYTVIDGVPRVDSITLTPGGTIYAERGKTVQFSVAMGGFNLRDEAKQVNWYLIASGGMPYTSTLSSDGLLRIATDEPNELMRVFVFSEYDGTKQADTIVVITDPSKGIFGTKPQYNQWYHYILFFLCFGFIWMWF